MTTVAVITICTGIIACKAQVTSFFGIVNVRRGAPIEAVLPFAAARPIVVPARCRQKDAVTVLFACYFITVLTSLSSPLPDTFFKKFIKFSFGRKSPGASPFFAGDIVATVTSNITDILVIGDRIAIDIATLGGQLTPGVVIAVAFGTACTDIAAGPLHTETEVDIFVSIDPSTLPVGSLRQQRKAQ